MRTFQSLRTLKQNAEFLFLKIQRNILISERLLNICICAPTIQLGQLVFLKKMVSIEGQRNASYPIAILKKIVTKIVTNLR